MGERAGSRMRSVSQWRYRLTHRFREQARSHSRSVLPIRVVYGAGAHRIGHAPLYDITATTLAERR
ncbi:hypothetical protein DA482_11995 [Pseudomonas fluorescens]|nr:hypothetical protein D0N73_28335 [Pseudomonas fluorescens]TWR43360.1 hypothetical protein FIP59_29260 [Pseudomonas fluorescens]